MSAGKTYYSTGIKGNFTFKIDKGTGVPKDDEEPNSSPGSSGGKSTPQSLQKAAQNIVNPVSKEKEKGLRSKRNG